MLVIDYYKFVYLRMIIYIVQNSDPSLIYVGVFGFSCLWSIIELFKQHERVEKGWFPANPKHHPNLSVQECPED